MKKYILLLSGIVSGVLLVMLLVSNTDSIRYNKTLDYSEIEQEVLIDSLIQAMNSADLSKALSVPVPTEATFCGEKVPLNIYYVREALERELLTNSYLHSSTIQNMKRAHRVFPIIEPILKSMNVPEDMKYLAVIESNLLNVVSSAKAAGIWQFMKETAQLYNLEVNGDIDERYNLNKSTIAACEYLNKMYRRYGSWSSAAASYNMGPGNFDKALEKQRDSSYYNLNLNSETARYVYRILAIKIIFEHPQDYGFYIRKCEMYPVIPTNTIEVDSTITDLTEFAFSHNINYRILREFNPWLRSYTLPDNSRKVYKIQIPKEGFLYYDQNLHIEQDSSWFQGF
ncbi:MAG: lytic transglycosylase domain-containing protein [Bacteroidales bacterium]|nr:lytic transglycosylase domain-containing protein [Bacteroidales bacterium]